MTLYVYDYKSPSVPNQSVELYASAWSSGCTVTNYSWNFGDGSATSGRSVYSVYHDWSTVGSKTVTVTVTDNCGNSTTATLTHTVVANSAPVANFAATVSSANPLTVYADPGTSTDTDPAGLYYFYWNWGDGSSTESYLDSNNGGIMSHTYSAPGTYTISLTAYDTQWAASQAATRTVTVGNVGPACTIRGTTGNDVLTGTAGNDVICGLEGNDVIKGQAGNDTIIGGPGTDKVDYANATMGVTVNLMTGQASGQGTDTLTEIENVDGSLYADRIDGNSDVNWLAGKAGTDSVYGQGGNDNVWGGDGVDTLGGGDGDDIVSGGPGLDTIKFGVAISADLTAGTATGQGTDILKEIENVIGSSSVDRIRGNALANNLQGGAGNDSLVGEGAGDRLFGNDGNDSLTGSAGTDRCDGGAGTDSAATCETRVSIP